MPCAGGRWTSATLAKAADAAHATFYCVPFEASGHGGGGSWLNVLYGSGLHKSCPYLPGS